MANRDFQYNRYGEKDVRPGHFRHGGGRGSMFHGNASVNQVSMPEYNNKGRENFQSENLNDKNYEGRGPKGWRRSDESIRDDACEALYRSWEVDASDIEVDVKEGCIYLRGTVSDRQQKKSAERVVENLQAVEDVHNELRIDKKIEGWIPGLGDVATDPESKI
jgi:hypothetical protein